MKKIIALTFCILIGCAAHAQDKGFFNRLKNVFVVHDTVYIYVDVAATDTIVTDTIHEFEHDDTIDSEDEEENPEGNVVVDGGIPTPFDTLDTDDKFRKVILYDNGTWLYYNLDVPEIPDSLDAGHLHAMVAFPNLKEGNQNMLLHLGHSFFRIGGEQWKIDPSSMYFSDKRIAINDFKIYNRDQGIAADGVLSERQDEACDFDIDNLDLSLVNMLMKDPINIRGKLSGEGKISSLFSHPDLIADIAVDSLYLAEQEIGHIALTSKWDDTLHRADLMATNTIQGKQVLTATGYYEPDNSNLFAKVKTEKMNV